ncbi:ribonuclease H-like domain-containing protein [Methanobacterium sp.]|uniref:ribonuclease H-like domain-containing protein n=1 Tax=Methanobacterium sp. TaxID=2164 RepID=UPI003C76525B
MEYENAQKLKEKLLDDHEGIALEDLIDGNEIITDGGVCYDIENTSKLKFSMLNPEKAREKILSDLKLLSGIGASREQKLQSEGYKTIEDLVEHERFGKEASNLLKIVDGCKKCDILDWISEWYSKSHPMALFSSSFSNDEDFIFLDIETLGFCNVPIILLGVAKIHGDEICVNQYLSRSVGEESAVLEAFLSHVKSESVFVTFNGQTFDVPYIRNRMKYFGIKSNLDMPHFDLLHFSRRTWSDELPNCQLTTIENHLFGIEREDDVPSGLVPAFYKTYIKTQNIGPLVPIIEHNRQDIITLALIFSRLHDEYSLY